MKKLLLPIALLFCFCACNKPQGPVLDIYHTNDIQGFYWARPNAENENREGGGLAVLKEMLDKRPADRLLFDSGDTFSKTREGQLGKLEGAIKLMDGLKYTAATLSAADLNLGWDSVEAALSKAQFPFVVSNLKNADGTQPKHIQPYIILERGGLKIAVMGLLSKADFPAGPRNAQIKVLDEVETLRKLIPQVQEQGANFIILLSSLGFELESETRRADEKSIAEEFTEINLILGGNSELSPPGHELIAQTHVSRSDPMLLEVEHITLSFTPQLQLAGYSREDIVLDKQTFGEDEEIRQAVAAMRASVKKVTGSRVGVLPWALTNRSGGQSTLGVYTAECIRRWGQTDIGIVNPDLFLADFEAGPVTEVDLLNSIPFNDRVMFLKIRGDELKNALEHTLDLNNYPQTSGINIVYDMQAPLGSRIKKITLRGAPLRSEALYSVSTTDHIVAGGFGHNEFLNVFEFKNTDRTVRDILRWCLYRYRDAPQPQTNEWTAGS